jgi:hypothetical protein
MWGTTGRADRLRINDQTHDRNSESGSRRRNVSGRRSDARNGFVMGENGSVKTPRVHPLLLTLILAVGAVVTLICALLYQQPALAWVSVACSLGASVFLIKDFRAGRARRKAKTAETENEGQ